MPTRKPKPDLITDSIRELIVWLIGATVASVPLWAPTYIFIGISFNKAALFYALVTILVLLYLILIWRDKSYLPKFNFVGWSFVGLVAILGLTTITSIQPYLSSWGTFNRTDGWIMWLYYLVFFIIATGAITTRQAWWKVVGISLVGTTGVVVYGLGQIVLWPGVAASLDPWRIGSTLDNPVFLGGYLALALPLTLAWALTRIDRQWRYWGLSLVVLETVSLVLTWSRGAWLAAFVGGLVFGIIYLYYFQRSWATRAVVVLVVGTGLLLSGLWMSQSLPEQSWPHEASQYFLRVDSLMLRSQLWQIAKQAVYDRPLLGWGLENFSVAFDRHYQVSRERDMPFAEAHSDRPHNEYLGMAISGGVFGLLAYIILLFSALWLGYRRVMKSALQQKAYAETVFYLGCLAVVSTYMVFALTAFQLVDIVPYLLLALAGLGQIFSAAPSARRALNTIWLRPVCLIIGVGAISLSYWSVIRPLAAVHLADQATVVFQQQKFSESWRLFQRALAQKSYLSNPIRVQMLVLADNQRSASNNQADFDNFQCQLADLLPMNHKTEPYNSYHYLVFGMYYGHLAEVWPEFLSKAEASFQHAVDLSPRKAETYWQWGNIYSELGDQEKAKIKYATALELEPANRVINYQVGSWYLGQGDLTTGISHLQWVVDAGYCPRFYNVQNIHSTLAASNYRSFLTELYHWVSQCNRTNQDRVHAIVQEALLYKEDGKTEIARETARQLLDYDIKPEELARFQADLGLSFR